MSPEITLVRPVIAAARPRTRLALHIPYALSGLLVVALSAWVARDVTPVIGAAAGLGATWLGARIRRRDLTSATAFMGAALGNLLLVAIALLTVLGFAYSVDASVPSIFWFSAAAAAGQGLLIAVGASTVVRSLVRGPRRA
ncbi:MAG TPA: hypothetical protein VKA84_24335 [Gemmatimonadaceae bacterium]|nr:hypothetical protein [Gemmatimonadaceae bacterium]